MTESELQRGLERREWMWAWLAALAAVLIRVIFADQRGFWLDEYYTLRAALLPFDELVRDRVTAGHSPLYFLYAKPFLYLGDSERVLRLSSALPSGALVLLMAGVTGALGLRRMLIPVLMLCVLNPYWVSIGTEFRYMMPQLAVAAGAFWLTSLWAIEPGEGLRFSGRPLNGIALGVELALLLWIHGSAQFIFISLALATLVEARRGRSCPRAGCILRLWPFLLAFLLNLPLVWMLRSKIEEGAGGRPSFSGTLKDLLDVTLGNHRLWPNTLGFEDNILFAVIVLVFAGAAWLAWRELGGSARHMVFTLLAGIPSVMLFSSLFNAKAQGPERYVATFAIPATFVLAAGYHAVGQFRSGRALRGAFMLLVVVQAVGAGLDRGDRHRDAIRWIVSHQTGDAPVLVSSSDMNTFALRRAGLPETVPITGLKAGERTEQAALERLRGTFEASSRGFVLLYHNRAPVEDAIESLHAEGYFTSFRKWKLGPRVRVFAVARDPSGDQWAASLDAPPILWGPSVGLKNK